MSSTTDGVHGGTDPAKPNPLDDEKNARGGPPPRGGGSALDRGSVLRATAEVLDEFGCEQATIRRISRHLGCAVGSIYRHFTDKNQLIDEVIQGRFEAVAAAAEAGRETAATTRAFVAVAAGRPEQYRLMFWLSAMGRGADEPAAVPQVMRRLVEAWAAPAHLGSDEAAGEHWGRLHGELMLGHHDGCGRDAEAALADLATPAKGSGAGTASTPE